MSASKARRLRSTHYRAAMVMRSLVQDAIHIGESAEMGAELALAMERLPNALLYWNLPSRELARWTTPGMVWECTAARKASSMVFLTCSSLGYLVACRIA